MEVEDLEMHWKHPFLRSTWTSSRAQVLPLEDHSPQSHISLNPFPPVSGQPLA